MLSLSQPLPYLLIYLFLMYIRPQEYLPMFMGVPIMPVFMILAAVMWASQQPKSMEAPQFRLLSWQYLVMVLSLFKSGRFENGFFVMGDFMPVVLMFFMVASGIRTVAQLRAVFVTMGIIMGIIGVHCVDQGLNGVGWTGVASMAGRVIYLGFLGDPNDLSMALLMAFPMVLHVFWRSGWLFKLAWLGVMVAMGWTILLCNSRGSILALGAMLMQYAVQRFGWKRSLLVAPLMLIPIILFGPSRMSDMSSKEESAEGRVKAWEQGFLMFFSNPLMGVGKGQFLEYHNITAHNSYMLSLAELGLIGFTIWLSNLLTTAWMSRAMANTEAFEAPVPPAPKSRYAVRVAAKLPPAENWVDVKQVAMVLGYGWTACLTAMFFLSRSYTPTIYFHMALVVAAYQMGLRTNQQVPRLDWPRMRSRLIMVSVAAVVFLFLVTKKLR